MPGMTSAPNFLSRVPVQFYCAQVPSLSITGANVLFNNPNIFVVKAGSTAKAVQLVNGTSAITGGGEFCPFALQIEWSQLGYTDYQTLLALQPYWLTFVSFRNIGYYGRLVLDGPANNKPTSADVISCKATFLITAPSDASGATTVNRIAAPTSVTTSSTLGTGWIPASTTMYYWLTLHSKWGETTAYAFSVASAGANSANTINWTWPASTNYCTYASLYVNSTNSTTGARLLSEVINGQTASVIDVVGYSGSGLPGAALYQPVPTVNTAYRGAWQGGVWVNETP